jgi:hypothetical protein
MRRWIRILGGIVSVVLALLAAASATRSRAKAARIVPTTEAELRVMVERGTEEAAARARRALEHIERARAAEERAKELLTKGAESDETTERVLDRWRKRTADDRLQ